MENVTKLFGVSVKNFSSKLDFYQINKMAVKRGYFVMPDACNTDTLDFLTHIYEDYNKTFYKEWNDIISKSRFELLADQVLHYFTTYGTNFTAEPFVPNDGAEAPDLKELKVIDAITVDELAARVQKMVYSGNCYVNTVIFRGRIYDEIKEIKSNGVKFLLQISNGKDDITGQWNKPTFAECCAFGETAKRIAKEYKPKDEIWLTAKYYSKEVDGKYYKGFVVREIITEQEIEKASEELLDDLPC